MSHKEGFQGRDRMLELKLAAMRMCELELNCHGCDLRMMKSNMKWFCNDRASDLFWNYSCKTRIILPQNYADKQMNRATEEN